MVLRSLSAYHKPMATEDDFLERCRADRAEYARALADLKGGRFKLGTASIAGGPILDITAEHAEHVNRIIGELDALIRLMEAEESS
jgi:hypothetical protein